MAALFESVLNISITATWLIFAVICAGLLLRRAPKWTRMLLWALVALRLVLPFTLESPLSLVPEKASVTLVTDATEPQHHEVISTEGQKAPLTPDKEPLPVIPDASEEAPVTPPVTPVEPIPDMKPSEQAPIVDIVPETIYAEPVKGEDKAISISLALSIVWIAGMAIMAVYFMVTYITMRVRLRDAVHGEGRVWYSDRIGEPFVFGIIRPRIYMPFSVSEKDAPHVLAHENSHIKRGDHIVKPLAFLILCVHWFNPAVWLAYLLFSRDMELACDEAVIRGMDEDKVNEYSHALVTLSTKNSFISLHPISFGGSNMKNRLKNILNYKKPTLWIIISALILCVAVTVCFFTSPAKAEDGDNAEGATNTESSTEPTPDSGEMPTEPDDENKEYLFKRDDADPVSCLFRVTNTGSMAYPFDFLNDVTIEIPTDEMFGSYVYNAYLGERVTDTIPERDTVITVTVTYSDGSSISCDTDYTERDGVTYTVNALSTTYDFGKHLDSKLNELKAVLPGEQALKATDFDLLSLNQFLEDDGTVYTLYHTDGKEYTLTNEDFMGAPRDLADFQTLLACSEPKDNTVVIRAPKGEEDAVIPVDTSDVKMRIVNGATELIAYDNGVSVFEYRTPERSYWFCSYHYLTAHNDTAKHDFTDRVLSFMMNVLSDYRTIKFNAEADEAAEVFFTRALPKHYLGYPFDYQYQELYSEYVLLGYEVTKEDGGKIYTRGTYAFKIKREYKHQPVIGGRPGEGEWEGWQYANSFPFILSRDSEGLWRVAVDFDSVRSDEKSDKYLQEGYEKLSDGIYLKTIAGMNEQLLPNNYVGYVMLCTDPGRISMISNDEMTNSGKLIEDILQENGAKAGFTDIPHNAEYTTALISNGQMIAETNTATTIVGLNDEHQLVIEELSAEQARDMMITDACTAHLALMKDGITYDAEELRTVTPTVIAQRSSGEILFIVIDGRQLGYSMGLYEIDDLINILKQEKCTDAALLYSATTTLATTEKTVNHPNVTNIPAINAWVIK